MKRQYVIKHPIYSFVLYGSLIGLWVIGAELDIAGSIKQSITVYQ